MTQPWKEGLREVQGGFLPRSAERVDEHELRAHEVEHAVQDYFRRVHDVAKVFDSKRREELFASVLHDFRDFLSDEQEGDDVIAARVLHEQVRDFVNRHTLSSEREVFVRFLSESAIAMSGLERHELKCFLDDFYFADEQKERYFVSQKERETLARTLRDGIVLADEMHVDDDFEEDPHFLESFEYVLDALRVTEQVERIRDILTPSPGIISDADHARIWDIVAQEESEIWRAALLARAFRFYQPSYYAGDAVKKREIARLEKEGIAIKHESLLEENLISAVDALFAQDELFAFSHYSFENFFPCQESVSDEFRVKAFSQAVDFLDMDLQGAILRFEKQFPGSDACILRMFSCIHAFMRDFLQQVPNTEKDKLWNSFEHVLEERGGGYYVAWKEKQKPEKAAAAVVPVEQEKPVVPSYVEPLIVEPLVVQPSYDQKPLRRSSRKENVVVSLEGVLSRLRAGGLLRFVEDVRKHPKRFAEILQHPEVQNAALHVLEQNLQRGLFGIVERAAPVFLGDDWKKTSLSLRTIAYERITQDLLAEYRGDLGPRLPEAILEQKAEGFGFHWNELVQRAQLLRPRKSGKRASQHL